jgi:ATP-binding cassette, subfamily A (ABC1), member 3
VLSGLVTRWILHTPWPDGLPCSDPAYQSAAHALYNYPEHLQLDKFAYGPPSEVSQSHLQSLFPSRDQNGGVQAVNWAQSVPISSEVEFNVLVSQVANNFGYGAGGFFLGNPNSTFAWAFDTYGTGQTAVFTQATIDMALMNTPIAFSYNVFAIAWRPGDFYEGLVAVFTLLGFSVYPGFFALYPTAERTRKVRAMHYSNGILSSSLWAAYALFDLMFIIIISVCAVVIWSTQYQGWYGLEYMFVVFLLYGMAGTAFSYVVSLFVPSQLAAMAATSLVQTAMAMLFFLGYFATTQLALTTQMTSWFNYIYYTTALVCPAISLFRALLITLNVYSLACQGQVRGPYPGDIGLFGAPILYLVVQFVLLVAFLIFWESGRSLEIFGIHIGKSKSEKLEERSKASKISPDAAEDNAHLSSTNDGLRVLNISKTFGSNKAVDDISFGILPSEKFALLGPNGAGKSTTISLIRGELRPDSTHPPGSVFIASDSLMHTPVAARNHLGVCPQFDAVDSMTLSEHLHFYARARGVPDKETNIRELISRLGLSEHANKLVKKLSGGTKRKLSLAIAMIANPSVLLLDEPSSGMDAASKRSLWATLFSVASGRCLLLTTHSMEEADALCDRAGIMAGKMLALGTINNLRAKHGDMVYIHLVHGDAPHTSDSDAEAMWEWVMSTFLVAETEKRSFGGQIRFAVPTSSPADTHGDLLDGSNLGDLFQAIEQNKARVGIRDYSVGPATLDQVFLNVVSKHNVQEENTDHTKPGRFASWFKRGKVF